MYVFPSFILEFLRSCILVYRKEEIKVIQYYSAHLISHTKKWKIKQNYETRRTFIFFTFHENFSTFSFCQIILIKIFMYVELCFFSGCCFEILGTGFSFCHTKKAELATKNFAFVSTFSIFCIGFFKKLLKLICHVH